MECVDIQAVARPRIEAAMISVRKATRWMGTSAAHGELCARLPGLDCLSEGFAMRAATAPSTILVHELPPLGDVSLAPRELTGLSQAELARSMAAYLATSAPDTDAEALGTLRRAFPRAPLAARVAALAARIRR